MNLDLNLTSTQIKKQQLANIDTNHPRVSTNVGRVCDS